MTVTLELKPEVEHALMVQAQAQGLALEAYLQSIVEDAAHASPPAKRDVVQFRAALDRLAQMGRDLPHLPSSAFSRESIYQDHD